MKRFVFVLVMILSIIVSSEVISFGDVTLEVLNPVVFSRSKGEPITEVYTFSSTFGGPATLKIINGNLNDPSVRRVTNATVMLNGKIIFGPLKLNLFTKQLEATVSLMKGNNTLRVISVSLPGGRMTIGIGQTVTNVKVAPTSITMTSEGAQSQLKAAGNLSDGTPVDITDPSFHTLYASSSGGIASVSSSGLVTAVANGVTNIGVTNGSFSASVPVTVEITKSSRTVSQQGGTLTFHNGLVLQIPPEAVPGSTQIVIKDVPPEQVDAIVMNPALTSSGTKRFLGGFSAEPDGLVFNKPVMATIPVLPLNPGEIPVQIEILLNEQRYRYVTSQFEYLRDQGVVNVNIQHFSSKAFVAVRCIGGEVNPAPEEWHTCTTCPLPDPAPEYCIDPLHLELPCCNIPESVRYSSACGYTPLYCHCCRENGPVHVEEIDVDVSTEMCQLVGSTVRVRYYGCDGAEQSCDLGETDCKDIDMNVTIDPPKATLAVGDHVNLHAFVKGTWNKGELKGQVAFSPKAFPAIWSSNAPDIADFPPHTVGEVGTIHAYKSYPDPIKVWAKVSDAIPNVRYDPAWIKVTGDYIEIRPNGADLCPGDYEFFDAILKNSADESVRTIDVNWESNKPSIANCDPCSGISRTKITAGDVGDGGDVATFTATSVDVNYDLNPATFYVDVSREIPKIRIASHQSGGKIPATGAYLVGTIEECGTRRVKYIQVAIQSNAGFHTSLRVEVADDGGFGIPISLDWGINRLTFTTYDANNVVIPNNMNENHIGFTLRRVPLCLKSGSTLTLPTDYYGAPFTYTSLKPEIASVDSATGVVTGHANGWAKIKTDWREYTRYAWVGVSTGTNYVATHQDDPFYEPEHELSPTIGQMLWQTYGYEALASDLNDKYFTGFERTLFFPDCVPYWGSQPEAGFLYDGTSVQSFFAPVGWPDFCFSSVHPYAVNEKGQVVGFLGWRASIEEHGMGMGFIYDHGVLSLVADPFAWMSGLADINNMGKAVGWSDSGAGAQWGFIYDVVSRTFTYIASVPYYINDSGQVLGGSSSNNGLSLWLYKDGVYEPVIGPRAIDDVHFHESGQVHVTYENGQSALLTRCAP